MAEEPVLVLVLESVDVEVSELVDPPARGLVVAFEPGRALAAPVEEALELRLALAAPRGALVTSSPPALGVRSVRPLEDVAAPP